MSREYGLDYPERPLMSTLSDLIGIPHFTTSRGSTVRRDFLLATAYALDIDVPQHTGKDNLIRLIWETANRNRSMPDDRLSPGGTVTNAVLQEIIDGIIENKIQRRVPSPLVSTEIEMSDVHTPHEPDDDLESLQDERRREIRQIALREGQDSFRTKVLKAYGDKCAVTGTEVPAVLEAAHILQYSGPKSNQVSNGLCLRRDIHALFDRGMIAVHEETYEILLNPMLEIEPAYHDYDGKQIYLPRSKCDWPSTYALRKHRLWARL